MSWLLHSMQPHISRSFLFLKTTKEIWDSAAQTHSQVKNFVRIYQLNQEIAHLFQGEKSLGSYFVTLQSMWEELDHYETFKPCQNDLVTYKRKMEHTRIFEFLARLNDDFKLVRVHIRSAYALPSLNEVHAFSQSEESKKSVMQQYSSGIPE